MTNEEIISQLNDIYFDKETWHREKLSRIEAWKYHEEKINRGELITVSDGPTLAGYVEFCINHGCCYINNLFIRPAYRRSKVIWKMKKRLFELCGKGKVFFGDRNKFNMRYAEVQLRSHNGR